MYRVLLIDDEEIIAEGLKKVVKWADYDCEVVGIALDASEGAEAIRRLKPDILFTDIRMPGMDGLTMLAGIRSEFPDMLVAVLTGYRDFSYAQEAIRLGVVRYLLKPSKMSEIEEALSVMSARLRASSRNEAVPAEASDPVPDNTVTRQAIAYIRTHYAGKLTLQDVADHCFVSQWHLSKLLNKFEKKSFYDILNDIRLEKARELLLNPRLKITEISEMVGYADSAHFARLFKKAEGMSAVEYRRANAVRED